MFKWFVLVLPLLLLLGAIAAGAANAMSGLQTATPAADLSISKTDSPDPVALGNNLTYTITVTNSGPGQAIGVVLTDTVFGSFAFVSATPNQGSCSGTNPITCNLGTLGNGATATVTIVVTPTATGAFTNMASVTSATTDPNTANNLATISTTVNPVAAADLSVTKTESTDPVALGNNLTYTISVTNHGPEQATGVVLTDTMFGNPTFVSVVPNVGSCSGTNPITCSLGTLVSGASATITVVVTPTAVGNVSNTAVVTSTRPDPNSANNLATISTTVNPVAAAGADLRVTKNASPSPVTLGNNLTYTATVTNHGPEQATGVTLSDSLPRGVTFVSATPSQGSCSGTSPITCNLGNLASGASATVSIVVTPNAAAALTNTTSVASATTDSNTANNLATISTTVNPVAAVAAGADLLVTKPDSPDPVVTGNNLTYTTTATNRGPGAATGVTLTDILVGSFSFVSATASQGSCTQSEGTITCNLGTLNSGASATITIIVTPTVAGRIINVAIVKGSENDATPGNNVTTERTTVIAARMEAAFGEIEFTGVIQTLPQMGLVGTWTIQGLTVNVTNATEIKGTFQIGSNVEVEGTLTAGGVVQAQEIKLEKNDRGKRGRARDNDRPGQGFGDRKHSHDGPPGLQSRDRDDDHHQGKGKDGRKHRRKD